jgi:hypothetical protein
MYGSALIDGRWRRAGYGESPEAPCCGAFGSPDSRREDHDPRAAAPRRRRVGGLEGDVAVVAEAETTTGSVGPDGAGRRQVSRRRTGLLNCHDARALHAASREPWRP